MPNAAWFKQTEGLGLFRTTVENSEIFKEELPALRETLIKAGWCNISITPGG